MFAIQACVGSVGEWNITGGRREQWLVANGRENYWQGEGSGFVNLFFPPFLTVHANGQRMNGTTVNVIQRRFFPQTKAYGTKVCPYVYSPLYSC